MSSKSCESCYTICLETAKRTYSLIAKNEKDPNCCLRIK